MSAVHLLLHIRRRRVEKREGRVADFCPICREIQAFDFFRVSKVLQVAEISVDEGELLGHFIRCVRCSFQSWVRRERFASVAPRDNAPLESLIGTTFPAVRALYAERLQWETLVRRSRPLDAKVRRTLLQEPFTLISPMVREHFSGKTPLDWPSGLGCLGTIGLAAAALIIAIVYGKGGPVADRWMLIALIVGAVGTTVTLYQFYRRPFRYLRRRLLPMLAKALRPLKPSRDEVDHCLAECHQQSLAISKQVKTSDVWKCLQKLKLN